MLTTAISSPSLEAIRAALAVPFSSGLTLIYGGAVIRAFFIAIRNYFSKMTYRDTVHPPRNVHFDKVLEEHMRRKVVHGHGEQALDLN